MDYMKPLIITGTIAMVGNGTRSNNVANYTLVEVRDSGGNIVTIDNVIISNRMDNYMQPGADVTLHLVCTKQLSKLPGKICWFVYAIDTDGRRMEDWPFNFINVAIFRLGFLALFGFLFLNIGLDSILKGKFIEFMLIVIFFGAPLVLVARSVYRTSRLIRAAEEDLGRRSSAKKIGRGVVISLAVWAVLSVLIFSVFSSSVFRKLSGQEETACMNSFVITVETAQYINNGLATRIEKNSHQKDINKSNQCGQYYAAALQRLPAWNQQTKKPLGAYLNDRHHNIYLGGPVGLKVTELHPEDYDLDSGSDVKIPVVQIKQGPGDPLTIAFPTTNDATLYRDALANAIHSARGRVINLE